jgi:hypothetical protein
MIDEKVGKCRLLKIGWQPGELLTRQPPPILSAAGPEGATGTRSDRLVVSTWCSPSKFRTTIRQYQLQKHRFKNKSRPLLSSRPGPRLLLRYDPRVNRSFHHRIHRPRIVAPPL